MAKLLDDCRQESSHQVRPGVSRPGVVSGRGGGSRLYPVFGPPPGGGSSIDQGVISTCDRGARIHKAAAAMTNSPLAAGCLFAAGRWVGNAHRISRLHKSGVERLAVATPFQA